MLRTALLRLFLESYLDISLCSFINFVGLYQAKDWNDFMGYFQGFDNIMNSIFAIFFILFTLVFPIWVFNKINQHYENLNTI